MENPDDLATEAPPAAPAETAAPPDASAAGKADKPAKGKEEKDPKPPKAEQSALVKAAKADVTALLERELPPYLTYHSVRHTEHVAKEARALAAEAQLDAADTEALLLAAWFHDTGYVDIYDGHEYRSMERASEWLDQHGIPAPRIELITGLIHTTHRDHAPKPLCKSCSPMPT